MRRHATIAFDSAGSRRCLRGSAADTAGRAPQGWRTRAALAVTFGLGLLGGLAPPPGGGVLIGPGGRPCVRTGSMATC
jgi:hypothetical protein